MAGLAHTPGRIVAQWLIDTSLATEVSLGQDWPVSADGELTLPDETITCSTTQGIEHGRESVTGRILEHYGVQVRIRSRALATGWAKANTIRNSMASTTQALLKVATVEGTQYLIHSFGKIGNILSLGKELGTSKRSLFTINVLASIRQL